MPANRNKDESDGLFYAVVDVAGSVIYSGRSLRTAAVELWPGRIHGKGATEPEAVVAAKKAATDLRKALKLQTQAQGTKSCPSRSSARK